MLRLASNGMKSEIYTQFFLAASEPMPLAFASKANARHTSADLCQNASLGLPSSLLRSIPSPYRTLHPALEQLAQRPGKHVVNSGTSCGLIIQSRPGFATYSRRIPPLWSGPISACPTNVFGQYAIGNSEPSSALWPSSASMTSLIII